MDAPAGALPSEARGALSDYMQVRNLWDEEAVVRDVRRSMSWRAS